ncbi:MAG TPA: hypothetical protein VGK34_07245 [Armatimonadota bacterium]
MITLIVMFILVFLAGLFATILYRNIASTTRAGETLTADYLAEAGIRFAGDQLTYGNDLADWRPIPEYPEMMKQIVAPILGNGGTYEDVDTAVKQAVANATLTTQQVPLDKDPDRYWLLQGYCRFTYGKGRFLLRVTYAPRPDDAMSKFIKIESIGRMGTVDSSDPTTLTTGQSNNLQRYKVAYKAIGITDYARFITNKDRRNDDFALGSPGAIRELPKPGSVVSTTEWYTREPFVTTFGQAPAVAGDEPVYGAPIRCNGNLMWNGVNYVWLNHNTGDKVEVAGDIKYAVAPYSDLTILGNGSVSATLPSGSTDDTKRYLPWTYINGNTALDSAATAVDPADASGTSRISVFNSAPDLQAGADLGDLRDGRMSGDYYHRPRNVTRLDPPIIDPSEITGGLNAYRDVTRNSGQWQQNSAGDWYNTGYYGWGNGLYIDNSADEQAESSLYTLRSDWTEPGKSRWWVGPYYAPPGVKIELTPYNVDGKYNGEPELIITHDSGPNQPEFHWYDDKGDPAYSAGERIIMPYPKNGIIFAEGNVRIKGTLAPNKQLTVVSEGTIYVEGNILKCPYPETNNATGTSQTVREGAPRNSAISLLAANNVCVNTTQFFGPSTDSLMASTNGEYFDISPEKPFWMTFSFGSYWGQNTDMGGNPIAKYIRPDGTTDMVPMSLYVRHSNDPSKAGLTYLNMLINYWTNNDINRNAYYSLYNFPNSSGLFSAAGNRDNYTYVLGQASTGESGAWKNDAFDLWGSNLDIPLAGNELGLEVGRNLPYEPWFKLFRQPGVENRIGFQLDQSYAKAAQGNSDYRLARAAVQPCDIRIEALMYAENGSFFVIPGEWFNNDPKDTLGYWKENNQRPAGVNDKWPFYGQPLDVKITVFGAVAENVPAAPGDVNAWMEKWGWIPPYHGSPVTQTGTNADRFTTGYRDPLNPLDTDANGAYGATKLLNGEDIPVLQQGLTFVYDRQLSCPRKNPMASNPLAADLEPIRMDDYNRMLPVTPKLPVSPQTLYFGQPT